MKHEISNEQIWQLIRSAQNDTPQLIEADLKNWFPTAFLQAKHWYWNRATGMRFQFSGNYGEPNSRGFDCNGNYVTDITIDKGETYRKMQPDEVGRLIRKEAERLKLITDHEFAGYNPETNEMTAFAGNRSIFKDGKFNINQPKYDDFSDSIAYLMRHAISQDIDHIFGDRPLIEEIQRYTFKKPKPTHRWYITADGTGLVYFTSRNEGFGFAKLLNGKWDWFGPTTGPTVLDLTCSCCDWRLADVHLVKEILTEEARKRGFTPGTEFECATGKVFGGKELTEKVYIGFGLDGANFMPCVGSHYVMFNGKWGKIVKPVEDIKVNEDFTPGWYKSKKFDKCILYYNDPYSGIGFRHNGLWDSFSGFDYVGKKDKDMSPASALDVQLACMSYANKNYNNRYNLFDYEDGDVYGIRIGADGRREAVDRLFDGRERQWLR